MLELLTLEPECHLDQTGRLDGATPLHLAVAIEAPDLRKDFIEFLLEKGANYTIRDINGETAEDFVSPGDGATLALFRGAQELFEPEDDIARMPSPCYTVTDDDDVVLSSTDDDTVVLSSTDDDAALFSTDDDTVTLSSTDDDDVALSSTDVHSTILIDLLNHAVPDPPTNAPYIPSEVEATYYLYGLPSKARFIARSSPDVWMKQTGPKAYLDPKELTPLGTHRLNEVWEDTVGPAMDRYLLEKQVQCTILHPLRIGIAGQPSPPASILVGVNRGTLSAELGIEVAVHCRQILIQNNIDDIHIIIHESESTRSAMMHRPDISTNPPAIFQEPLPTAFGVPISTNPPAIPQEPFSTTLGVPICNAKTPHFKGTGSFFFIDTANPGILYLLTARHVLFHPDEEENKLYKFRKGSGQPSRKVKLMGEATFEKLRADIARDWKGRKRLRTKVARDREDEKRRVIGHVTLSPPISPGYGDDGFTDDWAVIQINRSSITRLNFIGNAIDLGSIENSVLTAWMYPHHANPSSFKYPTDRLLRFRGTVSDQEMFRPDPRNKDHDNDPVIMVLKNGSTSNLTVGRLNTIRALCREYFEGEPGQMSKEVAVLPRDSKSGPFSKPGDSGSVVIDAIGRVCGIITGGHGTTDVSDCTFVTSINFLKKRLATFGIRANIFPPANL